MTDPYKYGRQWNQVRVCIRCGKEFNPKPYQIKHGSYYCASCTSKASVESAKRHKARKYRNNIAYFKRNPKILELKQKRYRNRYPEKYKARMAVQTEVRAKRMVRKPCEICSYPKTEAHHHDYSKPLDVRWLCKLHHDSITMLLEREKE